MATEPDKLPEWASTGTGITEPSEAKKDLGWSTSGGSPEKPPYQFFNWWQEKVYRWIEYMTAAFTVDGSDNLVITNDIETDTISEKSSGVGVTIDGVLLKDSEVNTDIINEKTGATGVTIDGVLLKDSEVNTDIINEKTGATGVTVDGVLCQDNDVIADEVFTDKINEKTGSAGVRMADDIRFNAGVGFDGLTGTTISGGVISVAESFVALTGEGDTTDNLDTITYNYSSSLLPFLVLKGKSSLGYTITIRDGIGNLILNGDFAMNNQDDTLMLLYNGSNWIEISRSNNA